jgi:YHS domain-containing protein
MTVETAAEKSEFQGVTYFFCSPVCKQKFDTQPEAYANADQASCCAPGIAADGKACCDEPADASRTILDPVCGMKVDPETAAGSVKHKIARYGITCLPHQIERSDAKGNDQRNERWLRCRKAEPADPVSIRSRGKEREN